MIRVDDDYSVRLEDLPASVRGMVVYDDEGWPNVYLNAKLSREEQRKTLIHELRHIVNDDAYNTKNIKLIEAI